MNPIPLTCPRCRAPLEPRYRGAAMAAGCRRCGGVWLGAAATETVRAALDAGARKTAEAVAGAALRRPIDADEVARCAECGTLMRRFTVGGIEVDHCDQHGTWYDLGELEEVALRLAAQARGAHVAIEDQGVPGPKPVEPGRSWRQGAAHAAALATVHDTGEDLELDVRGRRFADFDDGTGRVGGHIAKAFVPDEGSPHGGREPEPSRGGAAGRTLNRNAMERAKRIADLCRGADESMRTPGFDRRGRGFFDVLDVLGDALGYDD